jgi:cellulose biosynthesis protein BcsQ
LSAETICIASPKGGSGKTLITSTLATVLAALNKHVVMIDADAATTGLSLFFLKDVVEARKHDIARYGLFEINPSVAGPHPTSIGPRVSIIPASYRRINTETFERTAFDSALRRAVEAAWNHADYILIDAQAGADFFAAISMEQANQIVVVSEYDPVSLAGVDRLRNLFPETLTRERHWILLNKLLPEFASSFTDFLEVARYLPPIPWDADVVRAYAAGRLALDLDRGNIHTLAVMRTASALFGQDVSDSVARWRERRKDSLRLPYSVRLRQIDEVAAGYQRGHIDKEFELRRLERKGRALVGTLGLALSLALVGSALAVLIRGELSRQIAFWGLGAAVVAITVVLLRFMLTEDRRLRRQIELRTEIEQIQNRQHELVQEAVAVRELAESELEQLIVRGEPPPVREP